MEEKHKWKWARIGKMPQVVLKTGDDIANLSNLDRKHWLAMSMPVGGVRFDKRTLEFLDADHDGRIRTAEVLAAIDFLKSKGVDLNELFDPPAADEKALAEVLEQESDLAKVPPSKADKAALADWEAKGKAADVAILGADTAAAEAALAAVEPVVDAFFAPPEDMPLVTDEPDKTLPLRTNLNPRHLEAIIDFADKCVTPVLGARDTLGRLEWKRVKAAFAPYRAWAAAKPVMSAGAMATLEEKEKLLRYKLHLLEFLENFVNMRRLYDVDSRAIFQTGTLRIDAKEMNLCFHVDSEAAHSALAEKSKCCIVYLKLTRPADKAERSVCAVATAGTIRGLYAGRNGVFYDRDGKDWEAVVTKVVESEVSLMEAFWSPWRKLGEGIAGSVKKFLGERQAAAQTKLEAGAQGGAVGGAALASSVAALGIGVGMMGAAAASLMAALSGKSWLQLIGAVVALILVVSLPNIVLTWFKLRQRDIGAILNASGWAINRPMRFTMWRARKFTRCAGNPLLLRLLLVGIVVALAAGGALWYGCTKHNLIEKLDQVPVTEEAAAEAAAAAAPAAEAPAQP